MEIEVAKAAIDFVIRNAKLKGKRQVGLVFHGGGEPFLHKNMGMVKEAVSYFRTQASSCDLEADVAASTNGVMSHETLEWVASNFDHLNLSIDGPEDIQNRQRPAADGRSSFPRVMETVSRLESMKTRHHLRATITNESVSRMPEIFRFFSSISSSGTFALEPLFECGRCWTTKTEAPSIEDYIAQLIKTRETAMRSWKDSTLFGFYHRRNLRLFLQFIGQWILLRLARWQCNLLPRGLQRVRSEGSGLYDGEV